MSYNAEARVPTVNGAKYAAQLGKHWSHKLAVVEQGPDRSITFPKDSRGADYPGDALATLLPGEAELVCRIEASSAEQRDGLKGVVSSHLERFAFREAPLRFDWIDSTGDPQI